MTIEKLKPEEELMLFERKINEIIDWINKQEKKPKKRSPTKRWKW